MDRRDFTAARRAACAALALLAACSPTFNWRDTPVGDDGLIVLLPCKPDRAARAVDLAGQPVALEMAGCEAGGATFAVARAAAADPAQAAQWLAAWQAATRVQWPGAQIRQSPATVLRAAAAPAPVRLNLVGTGPDGKPLTASMLWFAQLRRDGGMTLYQATVLGKPGAADATGTFFEGLRPP